MRFSLESKLRSIIYFFSSLPGDRIVEINGVAMEGLNRKQAGSSLIDYKSCELRKSPVTSAGVEPVTSSSDAPLLRLL